MLDIDVDEIKEVNYRDGGQPGESTGVDITFKDGSIRSFEGPDLPEVLALLNHWTPPTA